jgi:hypothetical protein
MYLQAAASSATHYITKTRFAPSKGRSIVLPLDIVIVDCKLAFSRRYSAIVDAFTKQRRE